MKRVVQLAGACLASLALLGSAYARDPEACRSVTFGDVGWSDIAATTGIASALLQDLGYQPTKTIASPPIVFAGIKKKQIDAFLGYWDPSMTSTVVPFVQAGALKVLERPNLVGAKYTLAVPAYAADAGLKSFADIAKFRDQLDGKIYGIGAGNNGNAHVQKMIDTNQFGLGGFKLVESSEAAMLVQVGRQIRDHKMIVFLAWEPHPMNVDYKIAYLSGGDDVFGPNYGSAKVFTVVPTDYMQRCPNVGRLLTNLQFTTDMENHLMVPIMDHQDPTVVAQSWLKGNPRALDEWLAGVSAFDGSNGIAAVKHALGVQ
ncbi:choline ABC transporter substrate-binding protein [Paraburkholderia megapolitana]|uniref:Glycine betaine/proline transport system substrate-binding protein n=1 Tax=Paraburkholderia megapolitana TaxID=420953 RepID=A0A1I3GSL3_9BURK|nr:choline ABC transporter substrate-binding protein [Paraburkholderia megapolitana]QDQ83036.1 choline ABC transporter substrate-binding protein [Paraburkholderia megapolitana]SFI26414.1 glycine betaine/proline transport system substrate-binding protein [Paraburkholderia megapolitana]